MKKLFLLIPAFIVASSCTSPKSEVNTPAVEHAVVETVVDSTSIQEAEKVAESKSTADDNKGAAVSSGTTNTANTSSADSKPAKKKWSNKKKGAIIGATSGAVVGAVVSKKRVKGAVIGGAVGAGVGLGAGAILDKKEN
jgi:hypothetical protein